MKEFVIGLDVDSTICTHAYPAMGEDIGAIEWLQKAIARYPDIRIMLCTMRSGDNLILAVEWLEERGIPVWAWNAHPTQHTWSGSKKPHAHLYIDDRSLGIPLRRDGCVDWEAAGPLLMLTLHQHLGVLI